MTDLGILSDANAFSYSSGINDKGQVTGTTGFAEIPGAQRAFLFSKGIVQDLGTVGGSYSHGYGINNKGQVTGSSFYAGGSSIEHAFLYSDGTMQDLGVLEGIDSSSFSFGYGINNKGQVTGTALFTGHSDNHAFIYSGGTMRDLGTLGASSAGLGINDKGQVAGVFFSAPDSVAHAFLYSEGTMKALGTLGGRDSSATGINEKGQVVGYSSLAGNTVSHAFLYTNDNTHHDRRRHHGGRTMQDLGTLGGNSSAAGINDKGQVVGTSQITISVSHAFLYSDDTMQDLNDLVDDSGAGWVIYQANAINNEGQIAGSGVINGLGHAILLTPAKKGNRDR